MMFACNQCHAQLQAFPGQQAVACNYCGLVTTLMVQPMMMYPAQAFAPKCSRGAYILLGLFLGGLGIRNFVAGRIGSGIAQLLLTLLTGWLIFPLVLVGLWVLIEIIAVNTDGNGVRMS